MVFSTLEKSSSNSFTDPLILARFLAASSIDSKAEPAKLRLRIPPKIKSKVIASLLASPNESRTALISFKIANGPLNVPVLSKTSIPNCFSSFLECCGETTLDNNVFKARETSVTGRPARVFVEAIIEIISSKDEPLDLAVAARIVVPSINSLTLINCCFANLTVFSKLCLVWA